MTPLTGTNDLYHTFAHGDFSALATWDYTLPGARLLDDTVCATLQRTQGRLRYDIARPAE